MVILDLKFIISLIRERDSEIVQEGKPKRNLNLRECQGKQKVETKTKITRILLWGWRVGEWNKEKLLKVFLLFQIGMYIHHFIYELEGDFDDGQ